MKKKSTFQRLLSYMLAYKWLTLSAFAFVFLTTLVTTALPLLARTYIDQFISLGKAAAAHPPRAKSHGAPEAMGR